MVGYERDRNIEKNEGNSRFYPNQVALQFQSIYTCLFLIRTDKQATIVEVIGRGLYERAWTRKAARLLRAYERIIAAMVSGLLALGGVLFIFGKLCLNQSTDGAALINIMWFDSSDPCGSITWIWSIGDAVPLLSQPQRHSGDRLNPEDDLQCSDKNARTAPRAGASHCKKRTAAYAPNASNGYEVQKESHWQKEIISCLLKPGFTHATLPMTNSSRSRRCWRRRSTKAETQSGSY